MLIIALLAQLAEHSPCKREVTGSNPSMRHQIIFSLSVSGLYRLLWEQDFESSNLFSEILSKCRSGEIGNHNALKMHRLWLTGSSPVSGTKFY